MPGTRVNRLVRDSNAWASWAERFWRIAKFLGIDGWITASVWLAAGIFYSTVVYVIRAIPWYWTIIVGLIFATSLLHLWNKLRVAWSLRGLRTFDVQEFADQCCKYYADFSEFMVSRQELSPSVHRSFITETDPVKRSSELGRQWEEDCAYRQRTDALLLQKFGPRLLSIAQQLEGLGIPVPNTFHFSIGDHGGSSIYVGMVGELLRKGLLEEAKKLDPKITWGHSFR